MIVSNLQNSQRIEGLHPLFKSLFDYVKTHDLLHADLGRIEVDGDHLFINNVNPECVTSDQQVLELHHDYIDVHILLEGEEMIGWKALEDLQNETKAYSKEEDCALYSAVSYTHLRAHETGRNLVCRLLLEKKKILLEKKKKTNKTIKKKK